MLYFDIFSWKRDSQTSDRQLFHDINVLEE